MKSLSGRKAVSHERIVDVASHAIRRFGYHGVNATEVMRAADLTHGGFYAHFASRDALLSEAVERAGTQIMDRLRGQIGALVADGASPFRAFIEAYLSTDNVKDLDNGCPLSLLGCDVFRQAPEVIEPSRRVIEKLHRLVEEVLPESSEPDAAWVITSALVGAVQLARALGRSSSASVVLLATRNTLLVCYDV